MSIRKHSSRIFTYQKEYTHVANLTNQPLYVSYMGHMGRLLPALSSSSVPELCLIRPYKGIAKRKKQAAALQADITAGKIKVGSSTEVQAAITAKLQAAQ